MDFTLDAEQEALRDAVRKLLASSYASVDGRRDATAKDPGYDEGMWGRLAEMGVLALPFAEADGGMGAGPAEVALVAEQVGRALAPEPFVEAVVHAGGVLAALGTSEQRARLVPGVAEGSTLPAVARFETGAPVTATSDGEGWVLDGVKEPVLNGARADVLLVTARTPSGTGVFVVDATAQGVDRAGYPTFDGGRAARVSFSRTPAEPLGDVTVDAAPALALVEARTTIALCHEAVGAMEAALGLTTQYLQTRKQFGVPLKTFQALTFRAADMYVSLELARSVVLWATLVEQDGGDVVGAATRAALQTTTAAKHVGQEGIQLHGGIGMTDEYAVGHYTMRLTAIDQLLGGRTRALGALVAAVGTYDVVEPLEA